MKHDWTLFSKKMPPHDTTIIISNGPAMGYYHYDEQGHKNTMEHESACSGEGCAHPKIALYELNGKRVMVNVTDAIQWCLPFPTQPQPKTIILIKKTWWRKIIDWIRS